MNIKKIAAIAIPIIILVISVPIFINSASNLQQINQEKENSKPWFISQFQNVLGNCTGTTGLTLNNCKQTIPMLQQQCGFNDNPSVCSDPRINEIMTSTAQTVITLSSTNFITYTDKQFGFSIDYPSNWVVDNVNFPSGSIGIKNKMNAPDVLVGIKSMPNTGSFDSAVNTYINNAGVAGYPIVLQSQTKTTIKDKEAYRIQYTEKIGDTTCQNEDYAINGGLYVSVISFDNCDANLFSQFLPTYENMVSTFR